MEKLWTNQQEHVLKQIDKKFTGKGGLISWKEAYAFNAKWRRALSDLNDYRKFLCLRSIRRSQGKRKLSTDHRDKGKRNQGYKPRHPNIEQELKQARQAVAEVAQALHTAAHVWRRERRNLTKAKGRLRYLQNLKSNRKSIRG